MSAGPNLTAEAAKAWRLLTAPLRVMPDFVIAGAPKCGTSTLYDLLAAHPRIRRGSRKEPTNFLHYPGSRFRAAMHYPLAIQRALSGGFLAGDGSVEYFTHPDGPRNVREVIPQARLVFLLREPVERAWSDYQMFRRCGIERGDFDDVVERAIGWLSDADAAPLVDSASRNAFNPLRYVQCGMYARMLDRWFAAFPREQCLVVFSEEFFADPGSVVRRVIEHLGLSAMAIPELPIARRGGYSESMRPDTARALGEFYRLENERLPAMLGAVPPWMP